MQDVTKEMDEFRAFLSEIWNVHYYPYRDIFNYQGIYAFQSVLRELVRSWLTLLLDRDTQVLSTIHELEGFRLTLVPLTNRADGAETITVFLDDGWVEDIALDRYSIRVLEVFDEQEVELVSYSRFRVRVIENSDRTDSVSGRTGNVPCAMVRVMLPERLSPAVDQATPLLSANLIVP